MSKFTEKFYTAFYKAQENLVTQKEVWDQIKADDFAGNPLFTARELIQLHSRYESASDLLLALETLWGCYAQGCYALGYGQDSSGVERLANEEAYAEDLEQILKGAKA